MGGEKKKRPRVQFQRGLVVFGRRILADQQRTKVKHVLALDKLLLDQHPGFGVLDAPHKHGFGARRNFGVGTDALDRQGIRPRAAKQFKTQGGVVPTNSVGQVPVIQFFSKKQNV